MKDNPGLINNLSRHDVTDNLDTNTAVSITASVSRR